MARLSKALVGSLVRLVRDGTVSVSSFPDKELMRRLLDAKCVREERVTKRSSVLVLVDESGLRLCCGDYDLRLQDLEACLEHLEKGVSLEVPSVSVADYGEDHVGKRNLWHGCFLSTDKEETVRYAGRDVLVDALHPLLVADFELLQMDWGKYDLWIVENYQCFTDHSWRRHFDCGDVPYFVVCRWPGASKVAREAYCSRSWRKIHYFGDYDPAGINIFQQEYLPFTGPDVFEVPETFRDDIRFGSANVYMRQKEYWNVTGKSPLLRMCLDIIHKFRRCLMQEYYID